MNLAEYALNNRALVKFLIAVLVVGGIFSFVSMSKLEDPEIKVKQALVVTVYPGASAHKVELEVTDVLEKEIRAMGDIARVEIDGLSVYYYGRVGEYGSPCRIGTKVGYLTAAGDECSFTTARRMCDSCGKR